MPEQAAYDIEFYDLSLEIHPGDSTIDGKLMARALVLDPLNWFVLDLDTRLKVHRIVIPGKVGASPLSFKHTDGKLRIRLPKKVMPQSKIEVEIAYSGKPLVAKPQKGSWSDGFMWTTSKTGEPWLGVVSVLNGADIWWPCKDHPSDEADSMALHIKAPEPLTIASNGVLRDYVRHGGYPRKHTFHWFIANPINNYGVTINMAQYSELKDNYRSINGDIIPLTFWVMPENYMKAMRLFPQFGEHLLFLEKTVGPYPFRGEKYGVAQTSYSGMEHQTIISYGGNFKNNEFGFDELHFHELSHEWFANMVTAPDWNDWWLHEGIASYLEALYAEHLNGEAAYHDYMANFRPSIQNQMPLAPRLSQSARDIYSIDLYSKGAWALHTLRYLIGKEKLIQALRKLAYPEPQSEYALDGSQCRFATTDQFQVIVEQLSGMELDWFFNIYLRQSGLPNLITKTEKKKLHLNWLTPENIPFPMPVEVRIGATVHRVMMPNGKGTISIPNNLTPAVDPDNWILQDEPDFIVKQKN